MERNWSDAARAALEAYPWPDPREKLRAADETERVSFGERVEVVDLPLCVRQWLRRRKAEESKYAWHGESWRELTEEFEKSILRQALKANGDNLAATARALATTRRVVAYKAEKYGLA